MSYPNDLTRTLWLLCMVMFSVIPVTRADSLTPEAVMRAAQTAYFSENTARLDAELERIQSWSGSTRATESYAYAYLQFRRLQLAVLSNDEKRAKQAGSRCTDTLDRLLKADAALAEGHALLSACYGYLANLGGLAAIRNGSRSGKAIEAALAAAPQNPRVRLIDGFGIYFRPAFVGGDKAEGCRRFAAAADAFAGTVSAPAAVLSGHDWGAAEAFYFKGRCARDQGEAALAAEAFAKALQLAPDFKRAARALNNR